MPTLEFKGKQHIYAHHLSVPYSPLVADPTKSYPSVAPPPPYNSSNSSTDIVPDDNLIIHGDNLRALKALLPRYAGRVNCIYIDPPYNTGKEGWAFNDNVNSPLMQEWLKQNGPVDGEDLERHDKWLCMMWPRLQLLKELLAEDGVMFISIDDNEVQTLRLIMDEVLGANNYVVTISVVANLAGSSDQFAFAGAHEYCLVYAKDRKRVQFGRFNVDEVSLLKEWMQDSIGYYKLEGLQRASLSYSESLDFPIFVGPSLEIAVSDDDKPPSEGGPYEAVRPAVSGAKKNSIWRWSKRRILERTSDVVARRRKDGSVTIYSKQRPQLGELPSVKPKTVFYKSEYSSRAGGSTLNTILSDVDQAFPYPKAVGLIADILKIGALSKDAIIFDSFAGSGTTAHATLALNREDGGNRRFILVECEDYADTITAERVRRVIAGVPEAKNAALREGLGGSFTYCTLGDPFDAEGLLSGDSLPDYETLATFLLHTAAGVAVDPSGLRVSRNDGRFYQSETTDYYLYYEPDRDWLRSDEAMLTVERAKGITEAGREAVVFGAGKYLSQRELTDMRITFCQLPYELFHRG